MVLSEEKNVLCRFRSPFLISRMVLIPPLTDCCCKEEDFFCHNSFFQNTLCFHCKKSPDFPIDWVRQVAQPDCMLLCRMAIIFVSSEGDIFLKRIKLDYSPNSLILVFLLNRKSKFVNI